MTSSVLGISGSARTTTLNPLRGTNLPMLTMQWRFPCGALGPSEVNWSRFTPQGTTEVRARDRPIRANSNTSSVHVAADDLVRIGSEQVRLRSGFTRYSAVLTSDQ